MTQLEKRSCFIYLTITDISLIFCKESILYCSPVVNKLAPYRRFGRASNPYKPTINCEIIHASLHDGCINFYRAFLVLAFVPGEAFTIFPFPSTVVFALKVSFAVDKYPSGEIIYKDATDLNLQLRKALEMIF